VLKFLYAEKFPRLYAIRRPRYHSVARRTCGPVAQDKVGAGIDHSVRERDDVATVLSLVGLDAGPHVGGVAALGPRMHRDDDEVRAGRCLAYDSQCRRDVTQVLRSGIRREPDDGNAYRPTF
jgi:hypothetical protein